MVAMKLRPRRVERVWGRPILPAGFGSDGHGGPPIGEIWFEDPSGRDRELLVKFLFTSESLSIQVHPDSAAARKQGHARGKDEAWWVLAAEEGAMIGLGLTRPMTKGELKEAARDGRIVDMVDWRPAAAGQYYYLPAGTIHALGAGLTLVEIQQNADLTYRLFDFGRDRELQLDLAVEAADTAPCRGQAPELALVPGRTILARGAEFVLELWEGSRRGRVSATPEGPLWLVPIAGTGAIDTEPLEKGSVWLVEDEAELALETGARLLVAYAGADPRTAAYDDSPTGKHG